MQSVRGLRLLGAASGGRARNDGRRTAAQRRAHVGMRVRLLLYIHFVPVLRAWGPLATHPTPTLLLGSPPLRPSPLRWCDRHVYAPPQQHAHAHIGSVKSPLCTSRRSCARGVSVGTPILCRVARLVFVVALFSLGLASSVGARIGYTLYMRARGPGRALLYFWFVLCGELCSWHGRIAIWISNADFISIFLSRNWVRLSLRGIPNRDTALF